MTRTLGLRVVLWGSFAHAHRDRKPALRAVRVGGARFQRLKRAITISGADQEIEAAAV